MNKNKITSIGLYAVPTVLIIWSIYNIVNHLLIAEWKSWNIYYEIFLVILGIGLLARSKIFIWIFLVVSSLMIVLSGFLMVMAVFSPDTLLRDIALLFAIALFWFFGFYIYRKEVSRQSRG